MDAGVLRRGVAGQSVPKGHGEVPGQCPVQLPSQGPPHQAPHRTEADALMVPGSGHVSPVYIIQNLMLHQERSTVQGVVDKVLNEHIACIQCGPGHSHYVLSSSTSK